MRTYLEIAQTGDVSLLKISGIPTAHQLTEAWEEIVRENSEKNGSKQYTSYFELFQSYSEINNQYILVHCLLMKASITIDREVIKELRSLGYKINITSNEDYALSLEKAKSRVTHLITEARRKEKEIERNFGQPEVQGHIPSYEEVIAHLEVALGSANIVMMIDSEKLTLSKYNILKKVIDDKNRAYEQANRRRGSRIE